ncbi:MAG: phage minor head protein [Sterolibacterium sp.]|nr:phage minor head protein [Sterolibacterium sp.]
MNMPAFGFNTPFAEQLDFFRAKLNLPSARWDDIQRAAHDRAFIVAGAGKADLLQDLRNAVDSAINEGRGLEAFRKDFSAIVQRNGWTGWTGQGTAAGEAWRTKVIYQTNMSTSYAAGRYKQLTDPGFLTINPYWRYVHNDSVMHPRPLHQLWGNMRLTLRYDDPFWRTHFPPNGWGCQCRVTPVDAPGEGDATRPPSGWEAIEQKTGAQVGIDKGFDYAPGANVDTSLRQMVSDKLITYEPAITKALTRDLNRYIAANDPASEFAAAVLADRSITYPAWLGFPDNFAAIEVATGHDLRGYMGILPADVPRHVEYAHGYDGAGQRPIVLSDYDQVWRVLTEADSIDLGHATTSGLAAIVAAKEIEGEIYRAVFEIRPGKRNRTLALVSLVIKTK